MRKSEPRPRPSFTIEGLWLRRLGARSAPIAGVDEAGCAPWAGPVVAAAVVLDPDRIPAGIDDSKVLAAERRSEIYDAILAQARAWGVGMASVARIDRDNILQARLWAMQRAVGRLGIAPGVALIDGNRAPLLACRSQAIIDGDALSLSIAAASIVAKVVRDRLMERLGQRHPGYGWERNRGYGTPEHRRALEQLGVTLHHRRSFRPVQLALATNGEAGRAR
jgi:ribonuclease HII